MFFTFCLLTAGNALAAGTPAGTTIINTVTVNYEMNNVSQPTLTGSINFKVDRVINFVVTKTSDVTSAPSATFQALQFIVSNTSNTAMRFALQPISKGTNTWDFGASVKIYRDNNNDAKYDAADTQYGSAATFGDIASGSTLTVLVVGDMPASLTKGFTAVYDLLATAVDVGGTAISTQTSGANTAGVDTVFADKDGSAPGDGARDGKHSAFGTITVSESAVVSAVRLNKTVTVIDQWGGNQPISGATLRYTIAVKANGTANNVVITDPLPPDVVYIPNTLRLNDMTLTDAADSDAGDVGFTTANVVTIKLGNLMSASTTTVTFNAKIK